ncbi:MAG: HEPN domain-containing protein [Planctomycetota bacterium]|nr:HEPN domain-containing protein [Planctomycetota bacterium]MDA1141308.1 HEPN domain-containing protein [Planctomycetota bacterium]
MPNEKELARGWLQKGDSGLATGMQTVKGPGPYDTACFHAQQAAEKYLKALPAFDGEAIPRTHDLVDLFDLCHRINPKLSIDRTELAALTPYAVQLRYDIDFWPDVETARDALRASEQVRTAVLALLPLQSHP